MHDFTNRDNSIEVYAYKKMGCAILTHYNWGIYQNTGILQTYDETYGSIKRRLDSETCNEVAKSLGMSRMTLYRKLKKAEEIEVSDEKIITFGGFPP